VEHQIRKNLVLFVPGKMAAVLGSSIYGFAIGLYILAETGSSLSFAITLLMSSLPRIFFAPIAGAIADRWDRKRIIIATDFACAAWLILIFLLFTYATQSLWLLYMATAVLTTLNTFYSAAVTSTIYNMVGPDYLQKALSLNQAAASLSTILGPVLGGFMFGIFPVSTFMLISVATFTLSGIASTMITYGLFAEQKDRENPAGLLHDFKQGLLYVNKKPFIKQLILIAIWLNFWFSIVPVALPYSVLVDRKMEAYQLGIIEGAFSVGMMAMAVILSMRPEIKQKVKAIIGGMLGIAGALVLMGVPNWPLTAGFSNSIMFPYFLFAVILISSLTMIVNVPVMVLLQKGTPDEFRGRVMSLLETGCGAMAPLGFILFGYLLDRVPVWILLTICGSGMFILILYHLWKKTFIYHLREASRPSPVDMGA
jgi:MFS transporter, DHA3 family, macrolide efflux protein